MVGLIKGFEPLPRGRLDAVLQGQTEESGRI